MVSMMAASASERGFELGGVAGEEIYEAVLRLALQDYGLRDHAVVLLREATCSPSTEVGPVERRALAGWRPVGGRDVNGYRVLRPSRMDTSVI
jgi:hypothetical protein